jgi:hypothetical protein
MSFFTLVRAQCDAAARGSGARFVVTFLFPR